MTPTELIEYLVFAIDCNFPPLIKGKPGIGKSEIVAQAVALWSKRNAGKPIKLIISHPVVSDPTDYKGLPFPKEDGTADFLPYGELRQLIQANEKTVCFLDDLGQAPPSVQAACMQLLLARRINGHKISDQVVFIGATNRREDKAGVGGLLEPVKSRFASIVELEVSTDDWVRWAIDNDMPEQLCAFIRTRPELLEKFEPSKDIVNSPCPRTVSYIGKQQKKGIPKGLEKEVFKGAAGEAFAHEYYNYCKIWKGLPDINEIILNPSSAPVPTEPGVLYAVATALARKANDQSIGSICTYLDRLRPEIALACMKDAVTRNRQICNTTAYIKWASTNSNVVI